MDSYTYSYSILMPLLLIPLSQISNSRGSCIDSSGGRQIHTIVLGASQTTYRQRHSRDSGPMNMNTIMEHAPRVCTICKIRKKGCDKALPSCGYCTKRGLVCLYEDPGVTVESRSSLTSNTLWTTGLSPDSSAFLSTKFSRSPPTIEGYLHCDVCNVFRITGRTFSDVCDQYFRSFHRWLPIISQDLLMHITTTFVEKYPPADFSLLILAMILVTLDPQAPDDNTTSRIAPQTLYVELRMSFARVQAQFTASARLIQTALLISAYEYACGKPHAAYISVGISARMASVLRISTHNISNLNEKNGSDMGLPVRFKITEEQNIYWGIIMMERLVLFECPLDRLKPALDFPDPQTKLPDDLLSTNFSENTGQRASVRDISSNDVGTFGRQIQALSFLVQVLQLTDQKTTPISELIKLDEKLQGFLGVLMNQSSQRHTCGANGIIIRSLIRLHQHILKRSSLPNTPDARVQEQSHSALDTIARMMVEVAHDHLERFVPGNIDSLPLSCSYNMRSMMELIEDRWGYLNTTHQPKELEAFVALHEVVCRRWRSPIMSSS